MILPAENERDVKEDLPDLPEDMQIHYVKTADQALDLALGPAQPGFPAELGRVPQAPTPVVPPAVH